jgi:hypothetical protein
MYYSKSLFSILILLLCGELAARAQTPPASSGTPTSYEVDVSPTQSWVDTKIDLQPGEKLRFVVTGEASYAHGQNFGPDGLPRNWRDLVHQYAVPDGGHGALIARLGSEDAAQPFLVGTGMEYAAPVAGRLFLGVNQSPGDAATASGSFHAKIQVLQPGRSGAGNAPAASPAETTIPAITPALLDQIPQRVSDQQGKPGDMVNALIIGSEDEMVRAFTSAGWVRVDSSVHEAVVSGLLTSLAKKSYLTMPMSTLYLFNRPQDYGFAHAEPVQVVMSRHHLRVWKSPQQVNGQPVWCVAATHDVGFDRDQRNNGLTHKIDPAIDNEREYVNETLFGTGLVSQRTHVTPTHPLTEASTATGGSFHSDGRVLVLVLK